VWLLGWGGDLLAVEELVPELLLPVLNLLVLFVDEANLVHFGLELGLGALELAARH